MHVLLLLLQVNFRRQFVCREQSPRPYNRRQYVDVLSTSLAPCFQTYATYTVCFSCFEVHLARVLHRLASWSSTACISTAPLPPPFSDGLLSTPASPFPPHTKPALSPSSRPTSSLAVLPSSKVRPFSFASAASPAFTACEHLARK